MLVRSGNLNWKMWIFLLINRDILVKTGTFFNRQKIGFQAISLLFELVSSSIEVFWGVCESLDHKC